jgi:hypothetical protein
MKTKIQVRIFTVMVFLLTAVVGTGLLLTLNGCATTPARPTIEWPEFKKIEAQGPLPKQEGDEVKQEVTIGQLRNAVAIAKAYDSLVPWFNETVDYANASVEKGKVLDEYSFKLEKAYSRMENITYTSVGAVLVTTAMYLINVFFN